MYGRRNISCCGLCVCLQLNICISHMHMHTYILTSCVHICASINMFTCAFLCMCATVYTCIHIFITAVEPHFYMSLPFVAFGAVYLKKFTWDSMYLANMLKCICVFFRVGGVVLYENVFIFVEAFLGIHTYMYMY